MADGRRPRRKAAKPASISASHYVGYVLDEEPLDAIMKKFEELERYEREVAAGSQKQEPLSQADLESRPANPPSKTLAQSALSEAQLEELFVRTSAFTVKNAVGDKPPLANGTFGTTNGYFGDAWEDDVLGHGASSSADTEWDEYTDGPKGKSKRDGKRLKRKRRDSSDHDPSSTSGPISRSRPSKAQTRTSRSKAGSPPSHEPDPAAEPDPLEELAQPEESEDDGNETVATDRATLHRMGREADRTYLISRYEAVQGAPIHGAEGAPVARRRERFVDPSLPTYVRIPAAPLPLSWAKQITHYRAPSTIAYPASRSMVVPSIMEFDFSSLGNTFRCILMDPPFASPGHPRTPGDVTVEEWATLPVTTILESGFLFVWTPGALIPRVLRESERAWGAKYVENIAWVRKGVDNKVLAEGRGWLARSADTCLVMRKEGDIELRHQRNPDVIIDFVKPREPGSLTEEKPSRIYEIIETLLPAAAFNPDTQRTPNYLLEL